jgi:dTMP kinase
LTLRGRFITIEGIDGAGKSSHLGWVQEYLSNRGIDVVTTREPGGTPLGEALRQIVLHKAMRLETEALIMFAARQEHVETVIRPALDSGRWVLCDRFTDATFAYQGGGRGLDPGKIEILAKWVHGDLRPDLTLLFDVAPELAMRRLAGTGNAPDRFEREQLEFFCRVSKTYLDRAAGETHRFCVLDANGTLDETKVLVANAVQAFCDR